MGIFLKYGLFSSCTLSKYAHVTWPKLQISKICNQFVLILYIHVSVNSKPDHPPGAKHPGNFCDGRIIHSLGKKGVQNPHPRAYKNELKP